MSTNSPAAAEVSAVANGLTEEPEAAWTPPAGFRRHRLDADGLMGPTPFWGPFWDQRLLTSDERARFTALNEAYKTRFGIPFILAVKGLSKADILASFEQRLSSTPEQEFDTALAQVEKIALIRLKELLPA